MDRFETIVTDINTSLSQTCGNRSDIIFNKILNLFPKNYFTTRYINTSMAMVKYKRRNIRKNNWLDMKSNKPAVGMTPRMIIEPNEYSRNFHHRNLGYRTDDLRRTRYIFSSFFNDRKKNLFIDCNVDRMTMVFEFTIVVKNLMEQQDLFGYMKHNFLLGKPIRHDIYIEEEIPDSIIAQLSHSAKIPVYDENGSVKKFLTYMRSHSCTPIVYKKNKSKGVDKFYQLCIDAPLITIEIPSLSDGDLSGNVRENFSINFNVILEFNYFTTYYIRTLPEISHSVINDVDKIYTILGGERWNGDEMNTSRTTIIESNIAGNTDMREYYDELSDYKLFVSLTYVTDPQNGKDVTYIESLFESFESKLLLKYMIDNNIDPAFIFEYKVFYNDDILDETDYYISWKDMNLITKIDEEKELKLIIYINSAYSNFIKESNHKDRS